MLPRLRRRAQSITASLKRRHVSGKDLFTRVARGVRSGGTVAHAEADALSDLEPRSPRERDDPLEAATVARRWRGRLARDLMVTARGREMGGTSWNDPPLKEGYFLGNWISPNVRDTTTKSSRTAQTNGIRITLLYPFSVSTNELT